MMTPEKATMADMSGGKRDRLSDHTDAPNTTPNTRETKLSCWDPVDASGKANDVETVENGTVTGAKDPNHAPDDAPMNGLTLVKGDDIIDVENLILSGGAESGYDVDFPAIPKKLFGSFDDEDDAVVVIDAPEDNEEATAVVLDDSKPTKIKITKDDITEQNNNEQDNEKINKKTTEKEQKNDNNQTIYSDDDSTIAFIPVTTKKPPMLDLSTLKPHTAKWTNLDDFSKQLGPFLSSERDHAKAEIIRASDHLKANKVFTRDDWVKAFNLTFGSKGRSKTKFIKHLGARLASSDPAELLLPHEFNNDTKHLLHGPLANAWAGAYIFYGPGWIPEIRISLDTTKGIKEPTTWWNTLSPEVVKNIIPFGPDDIFSEGENSMHDLERHFRAEFKMKARKPIDPRQWCNAFTSVQDTDGPARNVLIKLAMTPIDVFETHLWFHDDDHKILLANSITNFWSGAYLLVGGPWAITDAAMEEADPEKPELKTSAVPKPLSSNLKSKTPPKLAPNPGVSFGAGVKTRSLFLSRGPRKIAQAKSIPKADKRKHQDVFYSVELPPIDSDWKESGAELTAQFVTMTEHFLNKDKKALIHQWDSSGGALSKKSTPIKSKQQARRFVNNSLFLRQGFETKIRIRVSHDVLPSLFEIYSSDSGMLISHDHIQEKERSVIGFLVGSCPEAINLADMRTSHENHSVLFGLKIMCEERSINLASQVLKIPFKLQTKAIHILVGAKQAPDARDRYNRVFGSRNEGGYPQGLHMRFVPDVADPRFPATPNTRMKAVKMMSKQRAFLDNTKVISTTTIAGVHTVVTNIGYSLCQSLMAIKSRDDAEMGLFISIDEQDSNGSYTTLFTVNKDRFDEASGLIPLFCILYVAKFGESAWEWFTEDAKEVLLKYTWNADAGQVMLIAPDEEDELDLDSDDEYFTTMADLLNIDTSATSCKGFVFDIDYVIEGAAPSKNQFGDDGSVKTFRDACLDTEDGSVTDSVVDDASAGSFEIVDPPKQRSTSPVDLIEADSATQATSTLTEDTPSDVASSLEQLMLQNPELARQLFLKTKLSSTSVAVSPTEGVDGK